MSSTDAQSSAELAPGEERFAVTVEVISYVNQFVGGTGAGTVELALDTVPGQTLRDVLRRLSADHPKMNEALWHGDEMGSHVEVIVNDELLGVSHNLDSPMHPGDRIILLGQYVGG